MFETSFPVLHVKFNIFKKDNSSSFENCSDYTKFMDYYAPAYDPILQAVVKEYEESRGL